MPDVATIDLRWGWNLISFPVLPDDRSIEAMFGQVDGLYTEVSTIHDGTAVSYRPNRSVNTLTEVTPGHGYWVKMRQAATLFVIGTEVERQTGIQLTEGWNLVPYLIDEVWPVRLALSPITGMYDEVRGFDSEAKSFFPALPEEFNTLQELEPGKGYLIHVTDPVLLVYP